jgi:transcriptional regulator with XRE-family HTH domain
MSTQSNSAKKSPHANAKSRARKAHLLPNTVTLAVGGAIRTEREARGLTQLSLAMAAEVERTRIGKLEGGHVNASVLSLASICHALGITLADLFAGIRLTHPPTTEGGKLRRKNQAVLEKPQAAKRKPSKAAKS